MVNNANFAKRLNSILKEYELSAATFADKINVGRATISHILSGRNKPSLDFVLKVVKAFPQVDLYWLLEGKGTFPPTDEVFTEPSITETQSTIKKEKSQLIESFEKKNSSSKKIKRIILFMEDGTFESYETS